MANFTSPPTNALNNINSFSIRYCPNGVFHLHFGSASVNVSEDVFMKMAITIQQAATDVRRLKAPETLTAKLASEGVLPENVVPLRH